jgi:hypothetical protein
MMMTLPLLPLLLLLVVSSASADFINPIIGVGTLDLRESTQCFLNRYAVKDGAATTVGNLTNTGGGLLPGCAALSARTQQVVVCSVCGDNDCLLFAEAATAKVESVSTWGLLISNIEYDEGGQYLVMTTWSTPLNRAQLWQIDVNTRKRTLVHTLMPTQIVQIDMSAYDQTQHRLYVTTLPPFSGSNSLLSLDSRTGAVLSMCNLAFQIQSIVACSATGSVYVWVRTNVATTQLLQILPSTCGIVRHLSTSTTLTNVGLPSVLDTASQQVISIQVALHSVPRFQPHWVVVDLLSAGNRGYNNATTAISVLDHWPIDIMMRYPFVGAVEREASVAAVSGGAVTASVTAAGAAAAAAAAAKSTATHQQEHQQQRRLPLRQPIASSSSSSSSPSSPPVDHSAMASAVQQRQQQRDHRHRQWRAAVETELKSSSKLSSN